MRPGSDAGGTRETPDVERWCRLTRSNVSGTSFSVGLVGGRYCCWYACVSIYIYIYKMNGSTAFDWHGCSRTETLTPMEREVEPWGCVPRWLPPLLFFFFTVSLGSNAGEREKKKRDESCGVNGPIRMPIFFSRIPTLRLLLLLLLGIGAALLTAKEVLYSRPATSTHTGLPPLPRRRETF